MDVATGWHPNDPSGALEGLQAAQAPVVFRMIDATQAGHFMSTNSRYSIIDQIENIDRRRGSHLSGSETRPRIFDRHRIGADQDWSRLLIRNIQAGTLTDKQLNVDQRVAPPIFLKHQIFVEIPEPAPFADAPRFRATETCVGKFT